MLVRDALQQWLSRPLADDDAGRVRLPNSLKRDPTGVRTQMLQRLSASRVFAAGDRAGVLRTAQARSGRAFRPDVRQRVIVKARVCQHVNGRGAGLAAHLAYLGRPDAGADRANAAFFDRAEDVVDASAVTAVWGEDRHHFRLVISPEHGDRIADLRRYTREVMNRVANDLGQPKLEWLATCHFDTEHPHAHVLVRGRRASGKDLRIPRDYIAYGIRARAQEAAHELLGDLSRTDAERRIWRETRADRFTGFDRRLLPAADHERFVEDGLGASGAWAALTRGRLRHLETLGLATRVGPRYRLDAALEPRLHALQLGQDMLRLRQQRRLETGQDMRELGQHSVRGQVVSRGAHDQLGAFAWVIVRDSAGVEYYARLGFGQTTPRLGRTVDLAGTAHGAVILQNQRGLSQERGVELGR